MDVRWRTLWRWLRRLMQAALFVGAVGAVVYWLKFSPLAVHAHRVERGPIVADVMGTGTLEARIKTAISPKIAGRIADVLVDQNQRVSTGELLVQLDDEELQQQVAIAAANVAVETAAIARLQADKERATAVLTQARQQHARVQSLMSRAVATQEESDKATEALNVALAGLSQAEAGITQGQRQLAAAEKTLEYHRTRLADTKVTAPFDGLIVRRQREPGDVVVPGSAVLSLIDTREIWVSAWVDETEMAKLKPDLPARVVFRSEPNQSYPGKVVRLGREADRETREFIVDVQVLQLPANWAVGQRVEVFIETSRKTDVLLLPAPYLVWRGGEAGVFVSEAGRAKWRQPEMGLRNPELIEVVSGLQAGDVLVTPQDPRTRLTDGRRMKAP